MSQCSLTPQMCVKRLHSSMGILGCSALDRCFIGQSLVNFGLRVGKCRSSVARAPFPITRERNTWRKARASDRFETRPGIERNRTIRCSACSGSCLVHVVGHSQAPSTMPSAKTYADTYIALIIYLPVSFFLCKLAHLSASIGRTSHRGRCSASGQAAETHHLLQSLCPPCLHCRHRALAAIARAPAFSTSCKTFEDATAF